MSACTLGTHCGYRHLVNGKCPTSFASLICQSRLSSQRRWFVLESHDLFTQILLPLFLGAIELHWSNYKWMCCIDAWLFGPMSCAARIISLLHGWLVCGLLGTWWNPIIVSWPSLSLQDLHHLQHQILNQVALQDKCLTPRGVTRILQQSVSVGFIDFHFSSQNMTKWIF